MNQDRLNLYEKIYIKIRNKIFTGDLKPGDPLPSENQLCQEYYASRETVRKGLKMLENERLIYSKPKIGYFVNSPNHETIFINFNDPSENIQTSYRSANGIHPDKRLQKILQLDENEKALELSQIIKTSDGIPMALEIKYLPYKRAYPSIESEMRYAVLPDITLAKVESFNFYTDVKISAIKADAETASALECKIGDALLLVEQKYVRQDGTIIGYSKHLAKEPYNALYGYAGVRE